MTTRMRQPEARPDFTITRSSAALVLGNLLDALFTLTLLQLNIVHEANPLMRWAYQTSPVSFMVAKLAMVQLGLVLLCLNRRVRAAEVAEQLCAVVYLSLLVYHLSYIAHLVT